MGSGSFIWCKWLLFLPARDTSVIIGCLEACSERERGDEWPRGIGGSLEYGGPAEGNVWPPGGLQSMHYCSVLLIKKHADWFPVCNYQTVCGECFLHPSASLPLSHVDREETMRTSGDAESQGQEPHLPKTSPRLLNKDEGQGKLTAVCKARQRSRQVQVPSHRRVLQTDHFAKGRMWQPQCSL